MAHSENALRRFIAEYTQSPDQSGRVIELTSFTVSQPISIPVAASGLCIIGNLKGLMPLDGIGRVFDVFGSHCLFYGVNVGHDDGQVFDGSMFRFNDTAAYNGAAYCTARAATFAVNDESTGNVLSDCLWLSAVGAAWRAYTSKAGYYKAVDTTTSGTPISATASAWTTLTNDDGVSNYSTLPFGVGSLYAPNTFSFSDLVLGDEVEIVCTFEVDPSVNNAHCQFRLSIALGGGGGTLNIEQTLPELTRGATPHACIAQTRLVIDDPNLLTATAILPQVRVQQTSNVEVIDFKVFIRKAGG